MIKTEVENLRLYHETHIEAQRILWLLLVSGLSRCPRGRLGGLTIGSVSPMLAVIMLVKKRGGQRRWIGIDSQGIACHLGDLLQNTGIFHGCSRRPPPGERAVSSHQDSGSCLILLIFKGTNDRFAGVFLSSFDIK